MLRCFKPARRRCGVSPILSAAITSAIILAAGLAIYLIMTAFSGASALDYQHKIDRSIAKYQLALSIDYVEPISSDSVKVWVRNYGGTEAVILDSYAYLPEAAPSSGHGFSMNATVPANGVVSMIIPCYGCSGELNGKYLVVRLYAIPGRLYDPEKPETYAQFGQYFALKVKVLQP